MEPHLRSPRKEYYQQPGNSVGRSPAWTPRSRGGLQRGEGPFGSGRDCGSGTYYGQDEQHISPAGHHDRFEEDSGLQKTLSNLSLGKTYSGSMDGSEMSGRLQRAHSRGLEQVAYPQQRGQQLTGRGSGELVGYPGRIAGRGEHMPGPYGPGRGRAAGPGGPGGPAGRGEPERGQGYRKLWQQVTKVGRGQKLGEGAEAVPFSDMTVEDLLRIVRSLPPEESAVAAVSRGLFYLDSRALAALLKELHKVGLSNRASELFDWLRSLPENHELAHLCDVYTYTTIISQCGSHQQLRKALELVAEMRGHGVVCNVHTYSALMNVCIKANELELALDVYGQLLREGCTPNLVTYNILIDIHGKMGNWQEAVQVLDALEGQGTKPEVRTYNTIISACNRSGQPEHALRVYERMLADGAQPTATTYTALISAYGKTGKIEEALRIFQDMVRRGCERNVITYSSLISACEKAGRWQLALELLDEMHRDNCKPNTVTFNALLSACAQAGQWKPAQDVFEQMPACGCKPDAVSYAILISAYDRGNQWCRALQALDEMQGQGHRPDVGVYNVVIEALTRSGVLSAQLKAAQIFQAATRQGQLRMMPQGKSDLTCIAFTIGTALLAVLQWLQDLRLKLSKNGFAGAALGESAALLLLRGKPGRCEAPPGAIADAVNALMDALHFPASATINSQGVRVELELGGSTGWIESEEVDALVAPLATAAQRKLPTDLLCSDEAACAQRCAKAFLAVKEFEESHPLGGKPVVEEDGGAKRREAVGRLVALGRALGLHEECIHDSVQLLDRLSRMGLHRDTLAPSVLGAIALISAKQGERAEPAEEDVERAAGCAPGTLADTVARLASILGGDTGAISALRILHLYMERLGCDFQDSAALERTAGEALQMMAEAVYAGGFLEFRPSLVAAGVLTSARRAAGAWPFWPSSLAQLTGYDNPSAGQFRAAVDCADQLHRRRSPQDHLELTQQLSATKAQLLQLTSSPTAAAHEPSMLRRAASAAAPSPAQPPPPGGPVVGSPAGSPLHLRGGIPSFNPDLLRTLSPSSEPLTTSPARTVSLGAVGSLA
ncbi:g9212 [Coccomyxa elongata]